MKWKIVIKPTSPSLTGWQWVAVRDNQEDVLASDQVHSSMDEARSEAREKVQEFEDRAAVVRDATVEEEFVPGGVVLPDPEIPEVPEPEVPDAPVAPSPGDRR